MKGETPSFPGNPVSLQQWIPSPLRGGGTGRGGPFRLSPSNRRLKPSPSPQPSPTRGEGGPKVQGSRQFQDARMRRFIRRTSNSGHQKSLGLSSAAVPCRRPADDLLPGFCLKPGSAFVAEHCGLPEPAGKRHNPPAYGRPLPLASRGCGPTRRRPRAGGNETVRFCTVLGIAPHPYRTRTRSDDQPAWTMASRISVGATGRPPPSPMPRRRPETTSETAECLAVALIRLARARWGVRGCTDLALASRQFATRMLPIGPPHSTDRIRVFRRAGRNRHPDSPVESGRIQAPDRGHPPQDEAKVCRQVQGCARGGAPGSLLVQAGIQGESGDAVTPRRHSFPPPQPIATWRGRRTSWQVDGATAFRGRGGLPGSGSG